jgi:hypothetical protein
MRTTLTIDSQVLAEFKRRAAESHRTISGLIEDALREHLSRGRDRTTTKSLDFPIVGGKGVALGVDLSSNAALAGYLDAVDAAYDRFRGDPEPPQGTDEPPQGRSRA